MRTAGGGCAWHSGGGVRKGPKPQAELGSLPAEVLTEGSQKGETKTPGLFFSTDHGSDT